MSGSWTLRVLERPIFCGACSEGVGEGCPATQQCRVSFRYFPRTREWLVDRFRINVGIAVPYTLTGDGHEQTCVSFETNLIHKQRADGLALGA